MSKMNKDTNIRWALETAIDLLKMRGTGYTAVLVGLTLASEEIESLQKKLDGTQKPRPIEEWHEDYGFALWWTFPIEEPPYCGSPLDSDWPQYHTHWTTIVEPAQPTEK